MRLPVSGYLFAVVAATLGCGLATPHEMFAQTPGIFSGSTGNKAVWSASSTISPSTAYVDATAFQPLLSTHNDICAIINQALMALPSTGGVIDARGIQNTTLGNPLTCAPNTTPWLQGSGSTWTFANNKPADILLPSANICIYTPWIIPDETRIFGDRVYGSDGTVLVPVGSSATGCSVTTLFTDNETTNSTGTILYMGWVGTPSHSGHYHSAPCPRAVCTGVAIQDVEINAQTLPTTSKWTAITNQNSSTNSYVDQIEYPGVNYCGVCSTAPSGASYSNFTSVLPVGTAFFSALNLNPTGGLSTLLDGASFLSTDTLTSASGTGVYIQGQGNNVQNTHYEDFGVADVEITSSSATKGAATTVINVTGGSPNLGASGPFIQTSVIQLDSTATTGLGIDVDVALLGISGACRVCVRNMSEDDQVQLINDQTTGETLEIPASNSNDTNQVVAMYVVGELVGSFTQSACSGTGNCPQTRFTTSPNQESWGVGNGPPINTGNECQIGSIYSNTAPTGTGANTIYVCSNTAPAGDPPIPVWEPII